jgi:hypothetical protein
MLSKKHAASDAGTRIYRTRMEYLQARRSALNVLIQSLEEYDRYRARRLDTRKRKTA